MNILHVTPYYKPAFIYGGPIYSVSALCEALVKHGHTVTVITTTANGDDELTNKREVVDNVQVIRFKRYTKNNTFLAPGIATYMLKNIKNYDVVHIHTWWNFVSIFALVICSLTKRRPVFSPRGMLSKYIIETNNPKQKQIIQKVFDRSMLSKVKFHATAESEAIEIKAIYPDADVIDIFNFVNIPALPKQSKQESETTRLIFLSRIDPKKGLEILFEALAGITWDYKLNIVGPYNDDYVEELKTFASTLGIDERIAWFGPVFGEKKFEMLADHDLLVLTSYNENFANVIIETLAMATPVLVSNMVGLYPYIEKENLGWVCDTNSNDVAQKLSEFKNDLAKREFIRNNAPGLISRDFDQDLLVEKYINYYNLDNPYLIK